MVKEVFGYLHSHWDREWYKTFQEYRLRLIEILDDIFNKLENNEINSFYLDGQTIALDDYLEIFPEKVEYIKELIKRKKIFVGPFYVLADEFLANGESLCRNLEIGIKEALKYGSDKKDFIGYLPDAFGHSAWMPKILDLADINRAVVWRGVGESKQEFYWASPDGTKIKTLFLANGYYQDFFAQKSYKKNVSALLKKLSHYTQNDVPILLPIGADHLACEDKIKAKIKNFNRDNDEFKIKLSSLKEYFASTAQNSKLEELSGELRNNLNNYILPSVASSRVYLKQKNMFLQWQLGKIIEPLLAFCFLLDNKSSKKEILEYAWKLLIQNQAHDSICGCSLDEVHKENVSRNEQLEQIINSLKDRVVYDFAKQTPINKIAIMNLSNYDYQGVVSFYSDKKLPLIKIGKKKAFPIEISQDIHNIPVQENYKYYYEYLTFVDAKGLSLSQVAPVQCYQQNDLVVSNSHIENEFLKVVINSDGTLNVKNKKTGVEFKDIFEIIDEADVGDSYNFSPIMKDKKLVAKFCNAKVIEDNNLRKILQLEYLLNIPSHAKDNLRSQKKIKHKFAVQLILAAKSKRLDIKIQYENFSKDHILKIAFKLPKIITEVISEDAFGSIKRNFKAGYDYKKLLPAKEYTELDLNSSVFQRFVVSQGLGILTKGLQEYSVEQDRLNITMLRCFGVIAKRRLASRGAAAGPPLPTPEGQCIGKQIAELSLVLSNDTKELFKQADFYYNPLIIVDGKAKKSLLKDFRFWDLPENFYLYSLKFAEDNDGVIAKIFNLSSQEQKLNVGTEKFICEANLLEENKALNKLGDILFKAHELKILRIKNKQ